MSGHMHTGKKGEELAVEYFSSRGYAVLETNWRYSHWEVDIIATRQNVLHFIEVKTRRTKSYGPPEAKVNNKKIQFLINAAEQYLYLHPQWKRIQYDILSIVLAGNEPPAFFLVEDVFL